MNMELLTRGAARLPEFGELTAAVEGGRCPVALSGAAAIHRAHLTAALGLLLERPVVLICADESEAQRLSRDLAALTGGEVPLLTARSFTLHHAATVSHQWEQRRLSIFYRLSRGEIPCLVCTVEGLMQRTLSPETLKAHSLKLEMGGTADLNALTEALTAAGYTRCQQVEGVGQFALRGGILDVYPPGQKRPVRVEFFGDEVDAMGCFDISTQRRVENIDGITLLPAAEILPHTAPEGLSGLGRAIQKLAAEATRRGEKGLARTLERDREAILQGGGFSAADRYLSLICPGDSTAVDYLPADACVLFSETARVAERARTYQWQLEEDVKTMMERGELAGKCAELWVDFHHLCRRLEDYPCVYLDTFAASQYPIPPRAVVALMAKQLPSYGVSLDAAAQDLEFYRSSGYAALVLAGGEQRCLDLQAFLREKKIPAAVDFTLKELPRPGSVVITVGGLSAGVEYPDIKLAVLSEGDRNLPKRSVRTKKDTSNRQKLKSYADLTPGDLVIHDKYGLGRFVELTQLKFDGVERDYIKIAYAGSDEVYVPCTDLDQVSKYIGSGADAAETKKLSRIGSGDWERSKSRARKAVQDLAKGLIRLYAQRQRQEGYAFAPDTPWQREFEEQFEYAETEDQLRSIGEIKRDMENRVPMDRLLCGDVGYGKTEVAFRAIMKCVMEGKQAAILAPTTVLARQHYLTALRRFSKYPVNIDVVSRFRTSKQMQETLRRVAAGQVDILIGTHRLFNKDVDFKDLGLLVVDEEQRFGVQHKERLKERFKQVDVLTLSATPIPRTLNMALSGIRDMSTLEEPPADRQPVQTYVLEHDWGVLGDAMRRELERGGQVYYLHNRVDTIDKCAARLQLLLGEEAAIGIAHGKMTQTAIDDVMSRMTDGELNVLVCTTIIETGIDLPNANTLIIEDADHLGLAQLHQIRGRVGRSSRRAFAYLTYRRGKVLSELSTKRLSAIREFAEFGSGFKIAMRDLEIRGAGNILGPEQSGFMLSVGYDMYLRLLEEAVLTEQGLPIPQRKDCTVDLPVSASIPESYVPAQEQRMDLYRRIAAIRSESDADDVVDELIDRYGEPPRAVNNLVTVALLRAGAIAAGITAVSVKEERLLLTMPEMDFERILGLCEEKYKGRLTVQPGDVPRVSLKLKQTETPLGAARRLVEDYRR